MVTKADETFNIPIWNKVMFTKEEAKKKLIKRAEFERYLLENIEI